MSSNLKISVERGTDHQEVIFQGAIDEDADFSELSGLSTGKIIFNLEGVESINSCGIREWIKYQDTIADGTILVYRKCPQVVVEQMNIVNGFVRKGGEIESFYAPYYDEENDEEVKLLITPMQVVGGKAPEMKNAQGSILEFDDIEAQYFNFLKGI